MYRLKNKGMSELDAYNMPKIDRVSVEKKRS